MGAGKSKLVLIYFSLVEKVARDFLANPQLKAITIITSGRQQYGSHSSWGFLHCENHIERTEKLITKVCGNRS